MKLNKIFTINFLVFIIYLNIDCWSSSVDAVKREKKVFKISVFLDDTYENADDICSYSVDVINRILKSSSFHFEFTINKVNKFDGFTLTKTMCNELSDGRIAIIGIGDNQVFSHISYIANSLKIPYIAIRSELEKDFKRNFLEDEQDALVSNKVNIYPSANRISQAINDLIEYYKWDYVTILCQESMGLVRVQEFLRFVTKSQQSRFRLQIRQLTIDVEKWIYLLKEVKLSGSSHIIVDIQSKYINRFLSQAEEVGLMTSYFHIVFTSLDLSILEYTPSANLTGFQLYEPNDTIVRSLLAEFNLKNMVSQKALFKFMPSEAVLIYDAFSLLANTIDRHNLVDLIPSSPAASCHNDTPWHFGQDLIKYIKMSNFNGLSGSIQFDQSTGFRNNFTFSIVDKTKAGVDLFGYWHENFNSSKKPIEVIRSYSKEKDQIFERLNRNLIVTTKIEAPYVIDVEPINNVSLVGNARYKGYCVDLLEKISRICNFTYTIKPVEDGFHGAFVNGKWNGIVSELINKKADLAVAALTISFQREQVIEFTLPFLNLGISILYKRPQKDTPNLFSFLYPLSIEIWLYMTAAYLVVSFILFVISRFSPYEWQNTTPCNPDNDRLENQFSMLNSFWFTVGSLMHQGTDMNPKAPSVRVISCAWAFFTLILVSSYTANLAAFLTVQRLKTPIENAEDLSRQTDIKYGAIKSGSTQNFFKDSRIETYEKMWNFMSRNPEVFVKSTEEGINKIKKESYAYLVESTTNEYMRLRDCDLMQIGGLLDTKGYGIGTPTGSPWRDPISNAILQLQENGELQELYLKWWEKEGMNGKKCDSNDDTGKDSTSELSLEHVGGVFLVLCIGLALAFPVALLEFIWNAKRHSHDKTPLGKKMIKELKFAILSQKDQKTIATKQSSKMESALKLVPSEKNFDSTKYSDENNKIHEYYQMKNKQNKKKTLF